MKRIASLLMPLIIVAALITACATQNYNRMINTWRGASIDDLFHIWGYPARIFKLPNGSKVLIYADGNPADIQYPVINPKNIAGCETIFELDQTNHVVNVTYNGKCVLTSEIASARAYQPRLARITLN